MRYNNNVQQVTPIDFLSDLEDLESGNHMKNQPSQNPHMDNKYKKYIRNENHKISNHAGMNGSPPPPPTQPYYNIQSYTPENYGIQNNQEKGIKTFNMPINSPSCLDVAEHIANCPICSKFYNTDKTIYIISIVILAIICLLLLKKIVDI